MFLLATSKWGSYLPFTKPPYISDIVLGFLLVRRILIGRDRSATRSSPDGTLLRPFIIALLLWISLEFARGSYSLTAIRDFAPYFYAVSIFLLAAPTSSMRNTMGRIIDGVLIFHGAWISFGLLVPSIYRHLPFLAGQINILAPRNDFDGAVCAIFAAYALHRALSGRSIVLNLFYTGWNVVLLLALKERAGLLSFGLDLVVVALLTRDRTRLTRAARAKALFPILLLTLPLIVITFNSSSTYQRLLADVHTYVPFVHASPQFAGATTTQHAREKAWKQTVHWVGQTNTRELAGVGFGPDFMHQSGADILLLGGRSSDVRSPHNYFVGTWARLGFVGLVLVSSITLCGLWLAVKVRSMARPLEDVDVLAIMVVVGLPIAAAVGVILESPFGAIPWFWALRHLSVRAGELRRQCGGPSVDVKENDGTAKSEVP